MGNARTLARKNGTRSVAAKPRKRAVIKIESNPVAARANRDAYDDLIASGAPRVRTKRTSGAAASRTAGTAKRVPKRHDAYDELIERAEHAERRRKAEQPMDEFDRYIARIQATSSKKKPKRAMRGEGGGNAKKPPHTMTWLLTGFILICVLVAGARLYGYANFIQMRNAVARSTFFDGTSVEDVDVSAMTLEDAITFWGETIEPTYAGRTATLDDGTSVTAAQMGYQSDYRAVLESVWDAQRTGTLAIRYQNLKSQTGAARNYPVSRALYDEAVVREFAAYVASGIDKKGSEASVAGFDEASYAFTFSEGSAGATLDQEKLVRDLKSALEAGGGQVTREIKTTTPTITAAELASQFGLVTSAVTNASSSSSARLTNIKLAVQSINATKLEPGEEFSFNGIVGQRTAARGYQSAPAFSGGELTEELGGGICQVSTTLFNAAVKANFNITERHAHSMPVSYVDKGKDATVNWGSQDLKFVNTSDTTIYIMATVSKDKRIKIGIFGKLLEDGIYITVDAQTTDTYEYETTYQVNSFLQPGQTNVLQKGRTGYKAVAYKMTWSESGKLLNKELLYTSTYAKRDAIVEVAPN